MQAHKSFATRRALRPENPVPTAKDGEHAAVSVPASSWQ